MATRSDSMPSPLGACIETPHLRLSWEEAPWDTAVFGFPVLQITDIRLLGPRGAEEIEGFLQARDSIGSGLVSCRLPHDRLRESMLLEEIGFRFIEMVYQPEICNFSQLDAHDPADLSPSLAGENDLPQVLDIAGDAFGNERFHVDPRLPRELGNLRYQNWVRSSVSHLTQRLYVLRDNALVVAFFVLENQPDGTCYWHLNAVAPHLQGKGYGLRAWRTMLMHAKDNGALRVRTSIVARNHRVLNLYARLGFRFSSPSMTFHWVRSE